MVGKFIFQCLKRKKITTVVKKKKLPKGLTKTGKVYKKEVLQKKTVLSDRDGGFNNLS